MESHNEVVRMILWDYDAAPDGCGMYVKLFALFPSISEAIRYRSSRLTVMYWGYIESLSGELLLQFQEGDDYPDYDEEDEDLYDWSEHESKCDGCSFCNPTAFRDED